jgi:DNA-binding MarR family transcriptional regulator
MAVIRELLSYRLHTVANLLSRGAELRYRREFGVSLWEWRSVGLLGGAEQPLSLNELARSAGIHKSQMSRVVSSLAKRGLVLRKTDAADARGVRLELSAAGRRLYKGLIRAAQDRDVAFRNCLSNQEKQVFDRALAKLAGQARDFISDEKSVK